MLDAAQVERFIKTLENGRLITVLRMDMQNIDTKAYQAQGYFYGDRPCVRVTLDCEAIFLRDWTVRTLPTATATGGTPKAPPMPVEVQKALGITPAPTTPVASGG